MIWSSMRTSFGKSEPRMVKVLQMVKRMLNDLLRDRGRQSRQENKSRFERKMWPNDFILLLAGLASMLCCGIVVGREGIVRLLFAVLEGGEENAISEGFFEEG